VREVDSILAAMRAEHDPLASHIFTARRDYAATGDNKSGSRRARCARTSYLTARDLGFRGSLDEWERLMGAFPPR
jgi:hypothetical protein